MVGTIDMQSMRYLNLFNKICNVQTRYCFKYNNSLIFVVENSQVTTAIGPAAKNVKFLSSKMARKIKIIGTTQEPTSENISHFVQKLVEPITFNKLEVKDGEVVISGGRQSRASLIGRNRTKEKELLDILKGVFGIKTIRFN